MSRFFEKIKFPPRHCTPPLAFTLSTFLCFSLSISAERSPNATMAPTQAPGQAVSIHEINTMLAFGVIDFALTSSLVGVFYVGNGYRLCAFGKSQAIPIINSAALIVAAAGARATLDKTWIATAGAFSTVQGVINLFRAYLGIWYHFIGGQALPWMPEHHVGLELLDESVPFGFSLSRFLNLNHHLEVAESILHVSNAKDPLLLCLYGAIVSSIPLFVFFGGIVQFAAGLNAAIKVMR